MRSTVKRLAAVAALGAMGIIAPISSASAASPPAAPARAVLPFPHYPLAGVAWPGVGWGGGLTGGSFIGPGVAAGVAVIGPNVITTAPSVFINTNIQVSAGGNLAGGQVGGW
jgi:hypothetical protein